MVGFFVYYKTAMKMALRLSRGVLSALSAVPAAATLQYAPNLGTMHQQGTAWKHKRYKTAGI
jgi:hypothetical protein